MVIDSNILIYALNLDSPKNAAAQNFLQSRSGSLVFTQQNILETLRVITHHKFSQPFLLNQAIVTMQDITEQATILAPTITTPDIAYNLISKYQITGSEIFDAYLVATALSHGVTTIISDNVKHLSKYQEITVINPFVITKS